MFPKDQFAEIIATQQKFAILSHLRPDGDAYGSSLALAISLKAAGKEVSVYNQDGLDPTFGFLPGSELIEKTPEKAVSEDTTVIAVDSAELSRLGALFSGWKRIPDLNIDHHLSNPEYGRINIVDSYSPATAQILYELLEASNLPITREVASNLYVGLMTDTGCFRFRQTTERTFQIAGKMVGAGADPVTLSQCCYQNFRVSRLLLLGEVLQATHFEENDRVAWFILSPDMFDKSGANRFETEGLIDHLQCVASVEVAFVLEVTEDGAIRGSLRSRGTVDVREICSNFGGGGHRVASGFRVKQPLESVLKQLLALIAERLPEEHEKAYLGLDAGAIT